MFCLPPGLTLDWRVVAEQNEVALQIEDLCMYDMLSAACRELPVHNSTTELFTSVAAKVSLIERYSAEH
jgi:hypothetical protein